MEYLYIINLKTGSQAVPCLVTACILEIPIISSRKQFNRIFKKNYVIINMINDTEEENLRWTIRHLEYRMELV